MGAQDVIPNLAEIGTILKNAKGKWRSGRVSRGRLKSEKPEEGSGESEVLKLLKKKSQKRNEEKKRKDAGERLKPAPSLPAEEPGEVEEFERSLDHI